MTANEELLDALIRHQVFLLRLSGQIRNDIHKLLDATEADISAQIRQRMARSADGPTPANLRRARRLMATIRETRLTAWSQVTAKWVEELQELALATPERAAAQVRTVSPAVLDLALPAPAALRNIVRSNPFEGRVLREWARDVASSDIRRINDQVNIGLVQGETPAQLARRVVGSARLNGRDGVTQITRRNAEAITRTAVSSISNQARREFFKENEEIFTKELYVSTLDGQTTPICRSLDGNQYDIGKGPIPPVHFGCRSIRVALLDAEVIGNRPTRRFTEQTLAREYQRANGLTVDGSRANLPRGHKGAFDKFAQRRKRELTGRVPAKTTYQQFLGRQSVEFQDDVLGRTRGRLFRRGELTLDKFVDRRGREIPLGELAGREAAAFRAAGLDPDDFS